MSSVETNSVKRIVLRFWRYRPWNTVKWTYTESDDKGVVMLKSENTTYLYKALLIAVFLWFANLIINLTGVQNVKSDFYYCGITNKGE